MRGTANAATAAAHIWWRAPRLRHVVSLLGTVLILGVMLAVAPPPAPAMPKSPPPGDPPPASISLAGTVRDFINQNNPPPTGSGALYNPDFENEEGDDRGLVQATLGADGTPVYAGPTDGTATTHGPTDFDMWYHDTPDYNVAVPVSLTLSQLSASPLTYNYTSSEFFPIDNQGWNDPKYGTPPVQLDPDCGGTLHNFSFTFQLHTTFTYQPGEMFSFEGDDDVFVFVDNTLEIDLGGVHPTEDGSITLGQPSTLLNPLNLVPGQTYPFDLFFAERHTCGSDIEITTSIPLASTSPVSLTTAAASQPSGEGSISDTATLSGGTNPTGSITFEAFPPGDTDCDDPPAFTSAPVPVDGDDSYMSDPFTPDDGDGIYLWVASYSGDASNSSVLSGCGDPAESSTVGDVPLDVTTDASGAVSIGGAIFDTAVISGGQTPTGSIEFDALGPIGDDEDFCDAPPAFSSTITVNGDGTYVSDDFVPAAPGNYVFLATYSGDDNNASFTTSCEDPDEAVTVNPAAPALTTTPSTPDGVDNQIFDTAHLTGSFEGTGTIQFQLFGPGDPECSSDPVFTTGTDVAGDGDYESSSFLPESPGTYDWVASYSGDANNNSATTNCGDEPVTVSLPSPSISTTASPEVTIGGTISDQANVTGGDSPTGTVTFSAYGPDDDECASLPAFTATVNLDADGQVLSGNFVPTRAGTYRWVASYSGDANNGPATTSCNDDNESVMVDRAIPTLETTASNSVSSGGSVSDTATITGGDNPTGTITFELFSPSAPTCNGEPLATSTVPVNDGGATSGPFAAAEPGIYNFEASYSGDANNAPVDFSDCGANGESVTVTASISISTTASADVSIGGSISDTATITGGEDLRGTVTFNAYGPDDPSCQNIPAFAATVAIGEGGQESSGDFTPMAPGTYLWVASYSGDGTNGSATSACGDPNETVSVSRAVPTLTTAASGSATVGETISDTAALASGEAPSGTITFSVFGPDDATCAGPPAFTSTVPVADGNSSYPSGPFTVTAAGTYRFVAAYSGDGDNRAVTTACNDPNESVAVTPAQPTLSTTASAAVTVGDSIGDTAVLAGGANATGTISFDLFGPGDPTCGGTPLATSTTLVNGDGSYPSGPFAASTPGTYTFEASYSGDANNVPIGLSNCADSGEKVAVSQASPSITTQASGPITIGGTISDTATLSRGVAPTGTITFQAFVTSPDGCISTASFTSTVPVHGNGTYSSGPFAPSASGVYDFVASYSGDTDNAMAGTGCEDPGESVVVSSAQPGLATSAVASTGLGGSISDTATLSGGDDPTGVITFNLFGAGDLGCDGHAIFTSTVPVDGNGNYTSDLFTPTGTGAYQWVASYGGDTDNFPATTACGDPGESSTVIPVPKLSTTASGTVSLGGAISDTAVLAGGDDPTGTITFGVYGPNDDTGCHTDTAFSATVTVSGDGSYESESFAPTEPGNYNFVAFYSGDTGNAPVGTSCGDPSESVDVTPASPSLTTTASASVTLGDPISDTAHLTGGLSPSGTITFDLFGPDDPGCSTEPMFTAMVSVSGDGDYSSGAITPTTPGTYQFVAQYGGDGSNYPVDTACGDANESVRVNTPTTTTSTTASTSTTTTVPPTTTSTTTPPTTTTSTTSTTVPPSTTSTTSTTVPSTTTSTTSTTSTSLPPPTTTTSTTSTASTTVPPPTTTTSTTPTTVPPPTTTTLPPTTTTSQPMPTTSTSTTAVPTTTTTPTTTPPLRTTARATTTVAPATTSSTSTTTSTTATTVTTPPPITPPITSSPVIDLRLDRISTPPDGPATAIGHGCMPDSSVVLSIGAMPIGSARADANGDFAAALQLNVPVGHYTVTAQCGVTLTTAIDVVLTSRSDPPASAVAILLILSLLILALIGTQFASH